MAGALPGCGGFSVSFGGGSPYGGYYYDDFRYSHDPYSYHDGYWCYDDYSYGYDDFYFVDYIDGWYYDGYSGCYYCKPIPARRDPGWLEEPAGWDPNWGAWETFVQARVDFLRVQDLQEASRPQVLTSE